MDDLEKAMEQACVQSRWQRMLIRCPVCYKPIGERFGNQWWFKHSHEGKHNKVPMEMNQNTPIGSYTVHCSDKNCDGGHVFAWVNESIGVNERIRAEVKSDG